MSKGQKELQQKADTRSDQQYAVATQAQQQLQTGTPEYQDWENNVKKRLGVQASGDYLNADDFDSNKSRLAEQNEIRNNALSLTPTGAGGLAMQYASPTQLALSQKISDNEFARDQAAQSEEDIRAYNANTAAQQQQLLGTQISNNQALMGTGFQQSNYDSQQAASIAAQRSSQFAQMVGMALGGVSGFLNPLTSALKGGTSLPAALPIVPNLTPSLLPPTPGPSITPLR